LAQAQPIAAPYNLPWQLRPAAPSNVVRLDSALALSEVAAAGAGHTFVSTLLVSYKVIPELSPFVRLGIVQNSPGGAPGAFALTNVALGATYGLKFGDLRFAAVLGLALPLGSGGGDNPDAAALAAVRAAVLARSAMDNALFAVNDLVVFPGLDLAWVAHDFTVQAELTLLELIRVRGATAQPDSAKTNLTMGLHVGYFVIPELSVGAELRYQRWLTTPVAVERDASGATRDNLTVALGLRAHLPLGGTWTLRPGLAYARGLDSPMSAQSYNVAQLDLALGF
jgi:hypothetical protein